MNKFICDKLMEMQRIYESSHDIGRKIAYLKAVSSIKNLTKEIENSGDVDGVRGVGERIKKKIKEIISTGGL
jgi:DNA polymerase lambda